MYPQIATAEAARRYYSAKAFLYGGARNVLEPRIGKFPAYDEEYFDDSHLEDINNLWFRYNNYPLKQSIRKYVSLKLKTNRDPDHNSNEPRLLLCSVDVEEGETVVFDSNSCKSQYAYDKDKKKYKDTINYSDGLMAEHIIASASIPLLFDYQWIPKNYDYDKSDRGSEQDEDDSTHENFRPFWDGGLLSNTPIRELISEHKTFWEKTTKINDKKSIFEMREEEERDKSKSEEHSKELFEIFWKEMVANAKASATSSSRRSRREELQQSEFALKADDIDVYIVNLWPRNEIPLPLHDYDLIKDRAFDIVNYDKTGYDLKVAMFVTDYIEVVRDLVEQLAEDAIGTNEVDVKKNKEAARKILLNDSKTRSKFRDGRPRTYLDLLIGRFDVNEKLRIERTEDNKDTISNKWTDLSPETISQLIKQGRNDASGLMSSIIDL